METEQLSQVDPVPGYIPPPEFDVPGHPDPSSSSNLIENELYWQKEQSMFTE